MYSHSPTLALDLAYVQTSRAVHEHTLVVDDKEAVMQRLEANSGEKTAALELLEKTKRPLDLTTLSDLREVMASKGHDLREIYLSLIVSLNGDRATAQEYMRAMGEMPERIEREIVSQSQQEHDASLHSAAALKQQDLQRRQDDVLALLGEGHLSHAGALGMLTDIGTPHNKAVNLLAQHAIDNALTTMTAPANAQVVKQMDTSRTESAQHSGGYKERDFDLDI